MSESLRLELEELERRNAEIEKELDTLALGEENKKERQEVETSNAQAAIAGAKKGLLFGGDDELAAFIQASKDTLSSANKAFDQGLIKGLDTSIQTAQESFRKHRQEYLETQRKLEEKHPVSFNVGDVVGTGFSYMLGPAPVGAIGHLSKLATTGFMHGAGRSDAETLGGRIEAGMEGAQMSGAAGMAGELIGPQIGKQAGKLKSKLENWSGETFLKYLRGSSTSTKLSKLNIQEKLKDKKINAWAEEVLTYKTADGKKN